MHEIKQINGQLVIQIGDVYNFGYGDYKILSKTTKIVNFAGDTVDAKDLMCLVENVETGKQLYTRWNTMEKYLPRWNRVVSG